VAYYRGNFSSPDFLLTLIHILFISVLIIAILSGRLASPHA